MTMANASSIEMIDEQLVDLILLRLTELGVRLHVGLRELGHRRLDRRVAGRRVDTVGELGEDEEVAGRHVADRRQRVETDQPVAERAVAVDAGDGEVDGDAVLERDGDDRADLEIEVGRPDRS